MIETFQNLIAGWAFLGIFRCGIASFIWRKGLIALAQNTHFLMNRFFSVFLRSLHCCFKFYFVAFLKTVYRIYFI